MQRNKELICAALVLVVVLFGYGCFASKKCKPCPSFGEGDPQERAGESSNELALLFPEESMAFVA